MNCLIVDENKVARDALKKLFTQADDIHLVAECENGMDAYNSIRSHSIDVIFLDVEMPDMNSLELIRYFNDKTPIIIFITTRRDYATLAFDINAADYIIKPVTLMRFHQALAKARSIYSMNKRTPMPHLRDFVFIRDCGMLKRLVFEEIHFIEATGDYVRISTRQASYSVHTTLKKLEEKLPAGKFLRVHRSYIVALNKIERIEDGVIVINNHPVPVAEPYRESLNRQLNIL